MCITLSPPLEMPCGSCPLRGLDLVNTLDVLRTRLINAFEIVKVRGLHVASLDPDGLDERLVPQELQSVPLKPQNHLWQTVKLFHQSVLELRLSVTGLSKNVSPMPINRTAHFHSLRNRSSGFVLFESCDFSASDLLPVTVSHRISSHLPCCLHVVSPHLCVDRSGVVRCNLVRDAVILESRERNSLFALHLPAELSKVVPCPRFLQKIEL